MPAWLPAAIAGAASLAGNLIGVNKQATSNRELAAYQHKKNMELLKYQLDYDSPSSQMGRFKDAGLNPNLVYGQGSPGNMNTPLKYPDVKSPDYQQAGASIGQIPLQFQQQKLMEAQTDLTNQKVDESGVKQDLMRAQTALVQANPNLNPAYVNSMVTNLRAVADLKKQEADFMTTGHKYEGITTRGFSKMHLELETLSQKFQLNEKDLAVKAKIIESKGFQNALQKIQVEWMRDKEITPQHIYMGVMLLLQKLM